MQNVASFHVVAKDLRMVVLFVNKFAVGIAAAPNDACCSTYIFDLRHSNNDGSSAGETTDNGVAEKDGNETETTQIAK